MTLNELRDYRNWTPLSVQKVYISVLAAGGWKSIFPSHLPRWASRVRNFFNVTPTTLKRMSGSASKPLLKNAQRFAFLLDCHAVQTFNRNHRDYRPNPRGELNPPPFRVPTGCPAKADYDVVHTSLKDFLGTTGALADEVYQDESNRFWYQMAAGSTIYHYGKHPKHPTLEAVYVDKIKGQNDTPVFKMISPDNTGGSLEILLKNDGYDMIGDENQKFSTRGMIITNPMHQGSYNYSETIQVGLAAHELRDVKPHVEALDFYLNPVDRFSPLAIRRFPEKDQQGKLLADQL